MGVFANVGAWAQPRKGSDARTFGDGRTFDVGRRQNFDIVADSHAWAQKTRWAR